MTDFIDIPSVVSPRGSMNSFWEAPIAEMPPGVRKAPPTTCGSGFRKELVAACCSEKCRSSEAAFSEIPNEARTIAASLQQFPHRIQLSTPLALCDSRPWSGQSRQYAGFYRFSLVARVECWSLYAQL
ncbi:hypothetical protein D9M68_896740 [compost metagenome]